MAEVANLGGTAIKPVGWDRTGWEAFKYLLFDADNGTILTRTPLSWLKITAFYIVYYAFLTGFWVACLFIFFETLPDEVEGPRWLMDDGLIGKNPGVGIRPKNSDRRIDSQMFVLKNGDVNRKMSEKLGEGDLNADYAKRVELFMKVYQKTPAEGYKPFDKSSLGLCEHFPYGYVVNSTEEQVTPCIFIKLNNIWNWTPTPINCTLTDEDLKKEKYKKDCPKHIYEHVTGPLGSAAGDKNIWIDCQGRLPADREALREGAGLEYFPPSRAISIEDFFPYQGQKNQEDKRYGYHPPLVAIRLSPSGKLRGQLIHVECRAYYEGVEHIPKDKVGLVQFEVQLI